MSEFRITSPRGLQLAGDLVRPVDSGDAVIIFAHGFLDDRFGNGRFAAFGKAFRRAGYCTCTFDFSGSGVSDDAPLTIAQQELDLRAICNWLQEQGLTRQVIFTYGFGAKVTLRARPVTPRALICVDPLLTPQFIDWNQVFSPQQLEELDRKGSTILEDDVNPARAQQVIAKETLVDLSESDPQTLLAGVNGELLIFVGRTAEEAPILAAVQENFHLLRDGSKVELYPERPNPTAGMQTPEQEAALEAELAQMERLDRWEAGQERMIARSLSWLKTRVPAHR